jgi:hypothetical protein
MDRLSDLLKQAATQARTPAVRTRLEAASDRLAADLRLAIAGKVKAGKSTLLNALLGEQLAATDAGECTRIVNWYHWGDHPEVTAYPMRGREMARPWTRSDGALQVDLGTWTAEEVDRIDIAWPTKRLKSLTVLDTPGLASIHAEISNRTTEVLTADRGRTPVADAVLYLMRHTHSSDKRFLESFHDEDLAYGTPMNSIGVLSRADEIGLCDLDAMEVAQRIAARYQQDPRIRRLCPIIIPVDGLLAHGAVTLRESEFVRLGAVAREPEVEELLLTADRFVDPRRCSHLDPDDRVALLERFGLFGVRAAVDMINKGEVQDTAELAVRLAELSGLIRLRSVVLRQFDQRSRILKAHSALATLNEVLRQDGCRDPEPLFAVIEEITTGTHEFAEVRLLQAVRSGQVELKPERLATLDRLLGGHGHDVPARLELDDDADGPAVRTAALRQLTLWQRVAESPLFARDAQMAARTAVRTLEGILSQVDRT